MSFLKVNTQNKRCDIHRIIVRSWVRQKASELLTHVVFHKQHGQFRLFCCIVSDEFFWEYSVISHRYFKLLSFYYSLLQPCLKQLFSCLTFKTYKLMFPTKRINLKIIPSPPPKKRCNKSVYKTRGIIAIIVSFDHV